MGVECDKGGMVKVQIRKIHLEGPCKLGGRAHANSFNFNCLTEEKLQCVPGTFFISEFQFLHLSNESFYFLISEAVTLISDVS